MSNDIDLVADIDLQMILPHNLEWCLCKKWIHNNYLLIYICTTAPVIYIDRFQLITIADVCPIFGQTTAWDQTYTHNYMV